MGLHILDIMFPNQLNEGHWLFLIKMSKKKMYNLFQQAQNLPWKV